MIPFAQIQQEVKDAIAGHSYFNGITVLADNGLVDHLEEAALGENGNGVCVTVTFPLTASRVDAAPGLAAVGVEVGAQIRVNAERNAASDGAGKDIFELVNNAMGAVMAWRPASGPAKWVYKPAATVASFNPEREGEIGYDVFFYKLAAFKESA